ncbi:hypothetical protein M8C21_022936 [Ambrosia artemisiifolia]|uniref:carbonic anhydrase n=1 Tax=Ambrosia artemisiifolia TaxID=4212 RepID=A0AAD5CXT4_AMBAR|nr:hypothetical protein M8C21_022936 [Ambrosia artemisiifolia]
MINKSLKSSSILIALFIILCVPYAISQEVDDEHEFSYDVNSPVGPDHWGEIHSEWSMCNQGDLQSPIDLTHKRVQTTSHLGRLDRDYKDGNATLINRGHDMMLRWTEGAGHITINGTEYQLNQLHWHTPTEHTVNGRRYNLELHLVHQSTDGKIAVIGIMYKIGRPDSTLSLMEPYFKALVSTKGVEMNVGIIDPREIKIGSRKYYRYIGSLTTPPCHQNVIWTIVKKVRTVSREQLHAIREAVHDNADANSRPVQPLNNHDEHEFSYDVNSSNGPNHWGEIHPEWSMCNKGDMQSPIDLTHKRVKTTSKLGRLDRDYKPSNTTLVNRGHDMMLRFIRGAGHIHINGTEYQLNQAHWHTPTEHTINGRRLNLELHLVHQSIDEKVAVVGILYKIGRPDSFLATMEPYLKAVASSRGVETNVGIVDPQQIKIGSRKYYRYIGSLTTPPCDENVIWTIVRKGADANARPTQALNNRWLKLYRPDDDKTN